MSITPSHHLNTILDMKERIRRTAFDLMHNSAPTQGNACGDCRACWDASVPNVDYHRH